MSREKINGSSLCGGVISENEFYKDPANANMMAYVMPDKQFKQYIEASKRNDREKKKEIFDKYAWSQI